TQRQVAVDDVQVRAAHAAGPDPQPDFARPGPGVGPGFLLQTGAGRGQGHGDHAPRSSPFPARALTRVKAGRGARPQDYVRRTIRRRANEGEDPTVAKTAPWRVRAVILDVDGVLLASPHEQAWREALAGLADAARFTPQLYQDQVAGKPRAEGALAALTALGVPDATARAPAYAARKQA